MNRRTFLWRGGMLAVAGGLAGCSDDESDGAGSSDGETTDEEEPLALDRMEHADGEPRGYRQYEQRSDTTYPLGETVWFYAEPSGVTVEETDGGEYEFEILMELSVTFPDGSERDVGTRTYSQTIADPSVIEELYLKPSVSVSHPAEPGTYEAQLVLTDELDGESVTETMSFEVVGD